MRNKPRTIAAAWEMFCREVVGADTAPAALADLQIAFYTGAAVFEGIMLDSVLRQRQDPKGDHIPKTGAALKREIQEFSDWLRAGRP